MPLIEIHMREGRSADDKRRLLDAVTRAVEESLGAPRRSIRVWVHEFAPTGYMAAGELMADRER